MKTMKKRVGSIVAAIVLGITCILMQMPWISVGADTADDGVQIVTDEHDKVELLVGTPNDIAGNTVAQTIQRANQTYLLGIASQFGMFLEGDFSDSAADVESRMAVGGNANMTDQLYGQDDFDIGNGDYADKESLQDLIGHTGFAHAIVQGDTFRMISPESSQEYMLDGVSQRLRKTFVIGNNVDLTDVDNNYMPTRNPALDSKEAYDTQYFYKTDEPLIAFDAAFDLLRTRSEMLSTRQTNGNVYYTIGETDVVRVLHSYDANDGRDHDITHADASQVLGWHQWNTAHFVYEGDGNDQTVLFNLTEEEWDTIRNLCRYFSFENIPDGAEIVVSVAGEDQSMGIMQCTFINGKQITNFDSCVFDGESTTNPGNNAEECKHLLYNFYEATAFTLCSENGGNIAGNILAPNADVDTFQDNYAAGHLSGSLIAKSFDGCFEFGYMAYQGGYDMLGVDTGYTLELQKVDGTGELLSGAVIGLYDAVDDSLLQSVLTEHESVSDTINGAISFGGNAPVASEFSDTVTSIDVSHTYYVQESSAPDGYELSTARYYIDLIETYDLEYGEVLLIEATITLYPVTDGTEKPAAGGVSYTVEMSYTWNANGDSIEEKNFTIDSETYTLQLNANDEWTYNGEVLDDSTQIPGCTVDAVNAIIYPNLQVPTADGDTNSVMQFVNQQALSIHKVNESGSELSGAELSVVRVEDGEETPVTSFTTNSSAKVLSIGTDILANDTDETTPYYILQEDTAPSGYELAAPIYFYLSGSAASGYTLHTTETVTEAGTPDWTQADVSDATILTMTDLQTIGMHLTIRKTAATQDETGSIMVSSSLVEGATVNLYAQGGILLAEDIFAGGASVQVEDLGITDTTYVENGMLKPGIYYLEETSTPDGYIQLTTPQYFEVSANADGTYSVEGYQKPEYMELQCVQDGSNPKWIVYNADSDGLNIPNVTRITASVSGTNNLKIYYTDGPTDGEITTVENGAYVKEFETPITLQYLDIQDANWQSLTVEEVVIETSNGDIYKTTNTGLPATLILTREDRTEDTEQITLHEESWGYVLQNFDGINTAGVTSVTIQLAEGYAATYFQVVFDEWTDEQNISINTESPVSSGTLSYNVSDSSSSSQSILQIAVSGVTNTASGGADGAASTHEYIAVSGNVVSLGNLSDGTSVTPTKKDVLISKVAVGGTEELAGASMQLTYLGESGDLSGVSDAGGKTLYWDESKKVITWTSGEQAVQLENLPEGDYTLEETIAPDGYTVITVFQFHVDAEGTITTTDTHTNVSVDSETNAIIVADDVTWLSISKQDIAEQGTELPGASMQLTYNEETGDLSNVTAEGGEIALDEETSKIITWTSGETALELRNLPDGAYTLEETAAPDGYTVITEFTFTIENGKVITEGNAEVTVEDGTTLTVLNSASIVTTTTLDTTTTTTTSKTTTVSATTTADTTTSTASESMTVAGPTQTTTTTTETTTTSTTTTETTESGTIAGPTQTTSMATTTTTVPTITTTTAQATSVTSLSTTDYTTTTVTESSTIAGPTQTTAATSLSTTEYITTTATESSTIAGPTQTTSATSLSTTEYTTTTATESSTIAGPTQTTVNTTTATTLTVITQSVSETTTQTTSTAVTTMTEEVETTATTTSETTADTTTSTTEKTTTITAAVTTTTTEETTTLEETTTAEETTIETQETSTTTETESETSILIHKENEQGALLGGASLQITDENSEVVALWISEENVPYVFTDFMPDMVYCLTELEAPVDYAIAEPIYFRMTEDGILEQLYYEEVDGTLVLQQVIPLEEHVIRMLDYYTGTGILTGTTVAEDLTATTTETSETTTTTEVMTSEETSNTVEETTSVGTETVVSETTISTTVSTAVTTARISTTTRRTSSSSGTSVSSSPKTGDRVLVVLAVSTLSLGLMLGVRRKK